MVRHPGLGRRLAKIGGGVVAMWLVVLLVLGFVLGERTAARVSDRIAESLQGSGRVADHDLALVRGNLQLARVEVRRADS